MKNSEFLTLLLIVLFSFVAGKNMGQELPPLSKTSFEQDNVKEVGMADFDGDGLLDLLLISTGSSPVLSIHRNNGDDTFTEEVSYPVFEEAQLEVLDLNQDNFPDIFVIGYASPNSVVALLLSGDGEFGFTEKTLTPDLNYLSSFCWLQYNDDPMPDLFISGISALTEEPATVVLIHEEEEYIAMETSFHKQLISKIVPIPDPERLFYIQIEEDEEGSTVEAETSTSLYTLSSQNFSYIALDIPDFQNSIVAQGNLNHDKSWDLFIYGTDKRGNTGGGIYLRNEEKYDFIPLDLKGDLQYATIQDLNNDGLAELLLLSQIKKAADGEDYWKFYTVSEAGGYEDQEVSLPADDLFITDYDKDGLPDFLLLNEGTLSILKYDPDEENQFPLAPGLFVSIPLEKGLLFNWSEGKDDKTPVEALSYEIMLKNNTTDSFVKSPLINQGTLFDLHYGYGSLGVENIYLYEQEVESTLTFGLTTFDNAHHTGPPSSFTIQVSGEGISTNSACLTTLYKDTVLCEPGKVYLEKLFEHEGQYWVSYKTGIISAFEAEYPLTGPELFYSINIDGDCIEILEASVDFPTEMGTHELVESCQGDTLELKARQGDFSYNWFASNGENLGSEQTLEYVSNSNETLLIEHTRLATGCIFMDTIEIAVIPYPELGVMEPTSIREGQELQLDAWGAENYEWSPAENMQNPDAASPIVKPTKSTTYYVKAWNRVDCIAYDSVEVTIIKDFFVPTLFSPNGDGKNESFAVIGSGVEQLKLSVYDGRGNVVWQANSSGEAKRGWDGSYKGRPLPPGNYAWELKGIFEDGSQLHFENKRSGFITLIR